MMIDNAPPPGSPAPDQTRLAAIEVEHLVKVYKTTRAVDDVSFRIARGSITGLLGGNGAGKTTTIAMIMGLVLPTSGSIQVLGCSMPEQSAEVLGRMNFESPYVDMPMRLTVRQNLTIFGRLYAVENLGARIDQLAADLDLGDFLDRANGKLSAGQKTRVALAKALINRPELLLLDEPTASLDPDTADWVRQHLQDYRKTRDATILLASHNMLEVERLCDRVIIMKRGRIGFSISFLEEMWARNLGNLMMSPLKPIEFLISLMIMSLIRLAIGVIPMTLLALFVFDFNFYRLGLPLIAFFCNLIFTSWSIGIFVSGLVLRNGLGAESIVWTLMFGIMPLACVYYPVSVLPVWLQYIAWTLPPTYVFEGMRALLIENTFRTDLMLGALAINAVLLLASFGAFLALLRSARKQGSLLSGGE